MRTLLRSSVRSCVLLAGVLCGVGLLAGCGGSGGGAGGGADAGKAKVAAGVNTAPAGIEIDLMQLWEDFGENEAKADADYRGKTLELHVGASKISRDSEGYRINVVLNEGCPPSVICYLHPSAVPQAAKGALLQSARVLGLCEGRKNDPTAYQGYVLIVRNCKFKE